MLVEVAEPVLPAHAILQLTIVEMCAGKGSNVRMHPVLHLHIISRQSSFPLSATAIVSCGKELRSDQPKLFGGTQAAAALGFLCSLRIPAEALPTTLRAAFARTGFAPDPVQPPPTRALLLAAAWGPPLAQVGRYWTEAAAESA